MPSGVAAPTTLPPILQIEYSSDRATVVRPAKSGSDSRGRPKAIFRKLSIRFVLLPALALACRRGHRESAFPTQRKLLRRSV